MSPSELALRKELALTRLRVARTELLLARTQGRPDALTTASSAVDLLSAVLEQAGGTRYGGRWAKYARILLRVAHVVLRLRIAR